MKVYLDLILVINLVYDFLILSSVSVLLKRNAKLYKVLIGALIGEMSIITLFVPFDKTLLILFKIILSIIMVLITFGKKNFLENIFYFYIVTIIIGGSQYLIEGDSYRVNIVLMLIISPLIIGLYIKSLREYKLKYNKMHDVIIIDGNDTYKLNGYMDTGNTLVDPITKYPVIMVNKDIPFRSMKYFYVPYKVINQESILKCVKVDKVLINNRVVNVLLGLCDKEIFKSDVGVILNENIREMI